MTQAAIDIRHCETQQDLKNCVELQRKIWEYGDEDLTPAAIFTVAQHTGGHALCAYNEAEAIGFALAFSARHGGEFYWHSHMVGVLPNYQNRGVGRLLKLRQREEALREGVPSIHWTFDPLELRNAYFNLQKLGVIVRAYIPNCYGSESSSPLHGSLPTDRFVAEWRLNTARVEDAVNGVPPAPCSAQLVAVPVPVNISVLKKSDPARAREIQARLRQSLCEHLSKGYAVTGFRTGTETCCYLLEPYEN